MEKYIVGAFVFSIAVLLISLIFVPSKKRQGASNKKAADQAAISTAVRSLL